MRVHRLHVLERRLAWCLRATVVVSHADLHGQPLVMVPVETRTHAIIALVIVDLVNLVIHRFILVSC